MLSQANKKPSQTDRGVTQTDGGTFQAKGALSGQQRALACLYGEDSPVRHRTFYKEASHRLLSESKSIPELKMVRSGT